ncbi:stalk domain-containing protein [Peptoniphilus mikwangii]|uniref:stalk domain-containing protein n=1 Tax=Peptoniphilus mikwangii TaxID=1354300 RepID=UPI000401F63D|nr:stalk domain-containing protein [Peptoniphilus mikwangii]
MKKILVLSLFLCTLIAKNVYAQVLPTDQKVTFDNNEVKLEAYNIDGNNYFKLRDIAAILNNSKVQFNIEYNEEKKIIEISRDKSYTKLSSDLTTTENKNLDAKKSTQNITIDGNEIYYDGYNINGNNFFKLRDLGQTIGFYVDYDEKEDTVIIKSEKIEPTDLIQREKIEIKAIATDIISNSKSIKISDIKSLKIEDFTSIAKSIVFLVNGEKQVSAKAIYEASNNSVVLKPVHLKYDGKFVISPILKIEQGEKSEFMTLKSNEINLDEILKSVDKKKKFKLILGFYEDENKNSNFKSLSAIEFKN